MVPVVVPVVELVVELVGRVRRLRRRGVAVRRRAGRQRAGRQRCVVRLLRPGRREVGRRGGGVRGRGVRGDHRRLAPVGEHPRPEEQEAQDGRGQVGGDQDRELGGVRRVGRRRAQGGEGAAGQREADTEDDQALRLMADGAAAAPHPEGQPPVRRRVRDRRDQQGERVGDLRTGELAEAAVEQQVEERRQTADDTEADQLAGQALRHVLDVAVARVVAERPGDPVQRQRA